MLENNGTGPGVGSPISPYQKQIRNCRKGQHTCTTTSFAFLFVTFTFSGVFLQLALLVFLFLAATVVGLLAAALL